MQQQDGATATEYALFAGLIAVVIALAVTLLGQNVAASFDGFRTAMGW